MFDLDLSLVGVLVTDPVPEYVMLAPSCVLVWVRVLVGSEMVTINVRKVFVWVAVLVTVLVFVLGKVIECVSDCVPVSLPGENVPCVSEMLPDFFVKVRIGENDIVSSKLVENVTD